MCLLLLQGTVLVAGAGNKVNTAEECCRACWELGGRPGPPVRMASAANATAPGSYSNGTLAGVRGATGNDMAAAAARGSTYIAAAPSPGAAAAAAEAYSGPPCNAWSFCSSPIGCKLAGSEELTEQVRRTNYLLAIHSVVLWQTLKQFLAWQPTYSFFGK